MRIDDLPDVLTPQQLHQFLPLGKTRIYKLLNEKEIMSIRVGKKYIIPKAYLLDFLNSAHYNDTSTLENEVCNTVSFVETEDTQ